MRPSNTIPPSNSVGNNEIKDAKSPSFSYKNRPPPYSIPFDMLVAHLEAGRPSSRGQYKGRCPAHDDRNPSLSFTVADGRLLFRCFRLCPYEAIVAALEARGLWPVDLDGHDRPRQPPPTDLPSSLVEFDAKLTRADNGVVQAYLRHRGIDIRALNDIMKHRAAWHPPSGRWWPAMVAAVRDVEGKLRSLHRTFLTYSDPPTKAPVEKPRLLWADAPSCQGCAIRLAPAAPQMLIGEGIETTASAMQLFGLPGWSAISATGLRAIELPDLARDVTICADNDKAGIEAAQAAMRRFKREGRTVRIKNPTDVKDFNDLLLMRGKP